MDATELKSNLSENDIISFLSDLQADPYIEGDHIRAITICHNSDGSGSHKLYYYPETFAFHCYTGCSCSYDIFSLIEQVKGIEFKEAFKYVKEYFGYTDNDSDIDYNDKIDISFFDKFKKKEDKSTLPIVDEKVLNVFHDSYHISWVKDYIKPSSMKKFGIKLDVLNQRIIIPTRSINGDLIGIRARSLNKEMVDKGFKYMPLKHNGVLYNFPMGSVLYGLYENMENIKRIKKIVLFEGEKSALALDSFYNGSGIGVAVGGSSFSSKQLDLIKNLPIEEVVIALDKEWEEVGSPLEKYYAEKIKKVFRDKLDPYCNVSVIHDMEGLLEEKDSPTDKGFDTWKYLWDNRLYISETGGINYGEK